MVARHKAGKRRGKKNRDVFLRENLGRVFSKGNPNIPLGPETKIGMQYLCSAYETHAMYQTGETGIKSQKYSPVLIVGLFWNPQKTRIRAAVVARGTTNLKRVYRSDFPVLDDKTIRKMGYDRASKLSFSNLQIIPNTPSFFGSAPLATKPVEESLWPAFIKCRAQALSWDSQRESLGLQGKKIKEDWIYEGVVFDIPADSLRVNRFAPDIKGALPNQTLWLPGNMTEDDLRQIVQAVKEEGPASPVTLEAYQRAVAENRDPYAKKAKKSPQTPAVIAPQYYNLDIS